MSLVETIDGAWNSAKEAVKGNSAVKAAAVSGTMLLGSLAPQFVQTAAAQEKADSPAIPALELILEHPNGERGTFPLTADEMKTFEVYDGTTYDINAPASFQDTLDKYNLVLDQIVKSVNGRRTRTFARALGSRAYVVGLEGEINEGNLFEEEYDGSTIYIGNRGLVEVCPTTEDRVTKDQEQSFCYRLFLKELGPGSEDEPEDDTEPETRPEPEITNTGGDDDSGGEDYSESGTEGFNQFYIGGGLGRGNIKPLEIADPTVNFNDFELDFTRNGPDAYTEISLALKMMNFDEVTGLHGDGFEDDLRNLEFEAYFGSHVGEIFTGGVGYKGRNLDSNINLGTFNTYRSLYNSNRFMVDVGVHPWKGTESWLRITGGLGMEVDRQGGSGKVTFGPNVGFDANARLGKFGINLSADYFKRLEDAASGYGDLLEHLDGDAIDLDARVTVFFTDNFGLTVSGDYDETRGIYSLGDGSEDSAYIYDLGGKIGATFNF